MGEQVPSKELAAVLTELDKACYSARAERYGSVRIGLSDALLILAALRTAPEPAQPSNERAAALRHLHDKLKSGEYDGTDVMAAWIAVEDLACSLERATAEPSADAEKLLEAYDAAWIEDQQIGMCPPETVTISVITRAKQRFTTARAAVLAAMRASPPPAPERRCHHGFDVLVITTAYESGFGHGQNLDGLPNPYPEGSPEHHAYSIGYDEGERRRRMNGSSGYCNQGTHGACTNKECMCKCHSPTKEEERTADPDPWCDDCRAWQCHCEHNTRETK